NYLLVIKNPGSRGLKNYQGAVGGFLFSNLIKPATHATPAKPAIRQIHKPIPEPTPPKPPPNELSLKKKINAPNAIAQKEASAIFLKSPSNCFVLSPKKQLIATPTIPRNESMPQLLKPFIEPEPKP